MQEIQQIWESIYIEKTRRHKNRYPNNEVITFIFRNFSDKSPEKIKILDIGCGWGNNLKFLMEEGFDAYGVDIAFTAVAHCQTFCDKVFQADAVALPFSDDYFDAVIDRHSIQCNPIGRITKCIAEAHRVLKPEGGGLFTMLCWTNHPERFFAPYLTNRNSFLSEKQVKLLFKPFARLNLDYTKQSFNNQELVAHHWNITAKK